MRIINNQLPTSKKAIPNKINPTVVPMPSTADATLLLQPVLYAPVSVLQFSFSSSQHVGGNKVCAQKSGPFNPQHWYYWYRYG